MESNSTVNARSNSTVSDGEGVSSFAELFAPDTSTESGGAPFVPVGARLWHSLTDPTLLPNNEPDVGISLIDSGLLQLLLAMFMVSGMAVFGLLAWQAWRMEQEEREAIPAFVRRLRNKARQKQQQQQQKPREQRENQSIAYQQQAAGRTRMTGKVVVYDDGGGGEERLAPIEHQQQIAPNTVLGMMVQRTVFTDQDLYAI